MNFNTIFVVTVVLSASDSTPPSSVFATTVDAFRDELTWYLLVVTEERGRSLLLLWRGMPV
jgi:hypothetical protein